MAKVIHIVIMLIINGHLTYSFSLSQEVITNKTHTVLLELVLLCYCSSMTKHLNNCHRI